MPNLACLMRRKGVRVGARQAQSRCKLTFGPAAVPCVAAPLAILNGQTSRRRCDGARLGELKPPTRYNSILNLRTFTQQSWPPHPASS